MILYIYILFRVLPQAIASSIGIVYIRVKVNMIRAELNIVRESRHYREHVWLFLPDRIAKTRIFLGDKIYAMFKICWITETKLYELSVTQTNYK